MNTIRTVDPKIARKLKEPLVYREKRIRKEKVSVYFFRVIFWTLIALCIDFIVTFLFSAGDSIDYSNKLTLEGLWLSLLVTSLVMHIWAHVYEKELKVRDKLENLRTFVHRASVFYVQSVDVVYDHIFAYVLSPYLNDPIANEDKVDYLLEENNAKLTRFNQDKVYSFFDKIFNPGKRIRYLIADEEKVDYVVKENEKILKEDNRDKE